MAVTLPEALKEIGDTETREEVEKTVTLFVSNSRKVKDPQAAKEAFATVISLVSRSFAASAAGSGRPPAKKQRVVREREGDVVAEDLTSLYPVKKKVVAYDCDEYIQFRSAGAVFEELSYRSITAYCVVPDPTTKDGGQVVIFFKEGVPVCAMSGKQPTLATLFKHLESKDCRKKQSTFFFEGTLKVREGYLYLLPDGLFFGFRRPLVFIPNSEVTKFQVVSQTHRHVGIQISTADQAYDFLLPPAAKDNFLKFCTKYMKNLDDDPDEAKADEEMMRDIMHRNKKRKVGPSAGGDEKFDLNAEYSSEDASDGDFNPDGGDSSDEGGADNHDDDGASSDDN